MVRQPGSARLGRAARRPAIPDNLDLHTYRMGIFGLPNELLLLIAESLAVKDLLSFRSVSQRLSSLLTPRLYHALLGVSALTALRWAATYGHAPLAELAMLRCAKADTGDPNSFWENPLHLAAMHNYPDVIRTLVKHGAPINEDDGYRTPLHVAAVCQSLQAVRVLLELGASMKREDAWRETPAEISAHLGDVDSMRVFLDAGLDFGLKDYQGQTILHNGVRGGKEMVEFLLERGGEKLVNERNRASQTPLHLAIRKDAEIIKLLVRHGADTEVKDSKGRTPIDCAIEWGKDLGTRALLECGANISGRG